jgi:hypothetical protein
MADWNVSRVGEDDVSISADTLLAAMDEARRLGGELLGVSLIVVQPIDALASGIAKLVDLGLSPDEAAAIAGTVPGEPA